MGELSTRRSRASTGLKEHLFLNSQLSPFGRALVGIYPDNAPKILADNARTSIRNANQIMRGDRKVTAKALAVLVNSVL